MKSDRAFSGFPSWHRSGLVRIPRIQPGSTTDITARYAQPSLIPVAAMVALLVYGFYISLAGQPVFGDADLLDG